MVRRRKQKSRLLFETEISWFVLAGAMDVFMTFIILRFSAEGRTQNLMVESNPLARWILGHWGLRGMVLFKVAMVVLVAGIAEFVGRSRPAVGRALLVGGTIVVATVVIYSMRLLSANL